MCSIVKLTELVDLALKMLYRFDHDLIVQETRKKISCESDKLAHAGEVSISFRFAHYLQNLLSKNSQYKSYVVDCEYIRHGTDAKAIIMHGEKQRIRPDVIVHKRQTDDYNLLVLEFKTYWNKNEIEHDKEKLRSMTIPQKRKGEYGYRHGALVILEPEYEGKQITWYRNGAEIPGDA